MKSCFSYTRNLLAALTLAALCTSSALAAATNPRVPQVPVAGGTLQGYLDGVGESINVLADQEAGAERWKSTVSGNSALTLMAQMTVDAHGNSFGVYNAGGGTPTRFEIFPATATAGQFAMASFRSGPNRLIVTLFNEDGTPVPGSTVIHPGVDPFYFGYYIEHPTGEIGYSEDALNTGGLARMLAFKGTGRNEGNWWLCFEDNHPETLPEERDFDDAIVFIESINPNPTAVSRTSWGALKSRFR